MTADSNDQPHRHQHGNEWISTYSIDSHTRSGKNGNSLDELHHTRSVAYSVELVLLNKILGTI